MGELTGGRVTIRIDELRLAGFPRVDRHRLVDAFELELRALIGEGGLPDATAGTALRPAALELTFQSTAEQIGQKLARSIYGAWSVPR